MFTRTVGRMSRKLVTPQLALSSGNRSSGVPVFSSVSATKTTYQAAVCEEIGKPLAIRPLPRVDRLEDTEVRVQIHNTSISFANVLQVLGKYQESPPVPFVPGNEIAGKVTEVGSNVKSLSVGDRVVAIVPSGGFAEEQVLDEADLTNPGMRGVWKLPANVSFSSAACLVVNYGTAHMSLGRRANLKTGEYLLVTGAAGGVGLAVIDVAVNVFGAKVIAACGGEEKCALAKECGAQYVIDYKRENMKERVMEITDDHGADVVFENIGGNVFKDCLRCTALEGRVLVIGFASGDIPKIPANHLLLKNISVAGVYWGGYTVRDESIFKQSCTTVIELCEQGRIKPHPRTILPLNKVNEAFDLILTRKSVGKICLQVHPTSNL